MQAAANPFKAAMLAREPRIGLWLALASSCATEICAQSGFDWMLIDGEHSPNDLNSILAQLQILAAYPNVHAVARVPQGHGHVGEMLIKQYLDLGVQTLLVPMVNTPDQAAAIVRAARYPQDSGGGGIRGIGGARASGWGRNSAYVQEANKQTCILVQIETREAIENILAIAGTEGVDGLLIGPADLSASLGHVGDPEHPEVQAVIENAILSIVAAGKAAGIFTSDQLSADRYLGAGATFVAVGIDTGLLVEATDLLASRFKRSIRS
ncbi:MULTISPECIES: aldolase/citrate lyase family protein [unclassified Variovorax]|uniref:aldolase/citrate lyase family protein n=1 Tax=unclassified Variovorax TaxID=663243 RepID=UPI000B8360F5|nr:MULTISPECIES: aldolase/citrate lyase family protein [unclassified Variovorax]